MSFEGLVAEYGVEAAVVALISIFAVGVFKEVFKGKLEALGSTKCKTIYQIVATVAVFVVAGLWVLVAAEEPTAKEWLKQGLISYAAEQVAYPVYENYHVRDLVRALIKRIRKEKKTEEVESGIQNS